MTALLSALRAADAALLAADEQMTPAKRIESVVQPLHRAMIYVAQALLAAQEQEKVPKSQNCR